MTWVTRKWPKLPINERSLIADRVQNCRDFIFLKLEINYQCDAGVFTLREL